MTTKKAKTPRKRKLKENKNIDVTFQTGQGMTAQNKTTTVNTATPEDALKQALQGVNPNTLGPVMISPTPPEDSSKPGMPNQPGQPGSPNSMSPNLPNPMKKFEAASYPYRVMLPDAFLPLMEQIVDNIDNVEMIIVNSRKGIVIENGTAFNHVTNYLDQSKDKNAGKILEGLVRANRK